MKRGIVFAVMTVFSTIFSTPLWAQSVQEVVVDGKFLSCQHTGDYLIEVTKEYEAEECLFFVDDIKKQLLDEAQQEASQRCFHGTAVLHELRPYQTTNICWSMTPTSSVRLSATFRCINDHTKW